MSTAAAYSIVAIVAALALVVALHALEPEFDPSWRMLSEYSLGRYGLLMRVAFLAAGSGVVAAAVALGDVAWPANLGLVVVALGPLGAAFIDTDPVTTPRPQMSRRSVVHTALGTLFILGFPLAATIVGVGVLGVATIGPTLAAASAVPWLALAWFLGTSLRHARPDAVGGPDIPVGWPNRVCMLAYLAWITLAVVLA